MKLKIKGLNLFYFLVFVIFLGCKKNYLFEDSYVIESGEWTYQDTVDFKFEIKDTTKIYNLFLDFEHSTDYEFQNLYINIYTYFPSGKRIKELVSFELANKGGVWFGDCDAEQCKLEVPIQQNAFFSLPGNYVMTVEQYMRKSPLHGIRSIALKIEETEHSRE